MKSVLAICLTLYLVTNVLSLEKTISSTFLKNKKVSNLRADVTNKTFTDNFFTQNLDHFDPTNNQTFQHRYFVDGAYFKQTKRSLVFLLIGGYDITTDWMSSNATWIYLAEQFDALAFNLEHRFYGSSSPTSNYTVDYLRYLTVEQGLADIAYFIESVNSNYSFTHEPEWIVFGGSYGGSLCTWARFKYPHLIKGSVCSSPVVIAKIDAPEYYDTVAEDIQDVSQECHDVIGQGFRQIQELAQNNSGREYLQNTALNLCENLTDYYNQEEHPEDNLALMLHSLALNNFALVAKYNRANRLGLSEEQKKYTLDTLCSNFITNSSNVNKSAVVRLGEYSTFWSGGGCITYNYTDWIKWMSGTTNTERISLWKVCTGTGLQQDRVLGTPGNLFGTVPQIDFYVKLCSQVFSDFDLSKQKQEALLNQTNLFYSGFDIQYYLTNTVHIHGSYDPWHKLGILESNNPNFTVIYLNKTSHCADMYPSAATDSPELIAARIQIKDLISSWIS